MRGAAKSLMNLPSFRTMYAGKQSNVAATVYVRMKGVDMGKPTDGIRSQTQLGSWAEFDMKFNEDAIYCSGISHGRIPHRRLSMPCGAAAGRGRIFRGSASVFHFLYDRWAMSIEIPGLALLPSGGMPRPPIQTISSSATEEMDLFE